MTNTYILPEQVKPTCIFKPSTLKAIIHVFLINNFHCKRSEQKDMFVYVHEGQSSIGNEGGISQSKDLSTFKEIFQL